MRKKTTRYRGNMDLMTTPSGKTAPLVVALLRRLTGYYSQKFENYLLLGRRVKLNPYDTFLGILLLSSLHFIYLLYPVTGRRGYSCSRPAQLHQLKLPTGYQTLPSPIPPRRGFNESHSYYEFFGSLLSKLFHNFIVWILFGNSVLFPKHAQ
uniref:Myosin motor domain-containing protein n=1 Tax=Heterorhabditis bacteriophora TaxID=37862 RepID=A0A1I7WLG1_HETBA